MAKRSDKEIKSRLNESDTASSMYHDDTKGMESKGEMRFVSDDYHDEPVEVQSLMNSFTAGSVFNMKAKPDVQPLEKQTEDDITEVTQKRSVGRPRTNTKVPKGAADRGTKEGEIRYTAILNEKQLLELKSIAERENLKIKDVFNIAIRAFVKDYNNKYRDESSDG